MTDESHTFIKKIKCFLGDTFLKVLTSVMFDDPHVIEHQNPRQPLADFFEVTVQFFALVTDQLQLGSAICAGTIDVSFLCCH